MAQINAYLTFNGNCREAMNFYRKCFGGELSMQTVEGSAVESECPAAMKHHILHATLQNNELFLMGSDMVRPGGFIRGNTIALSLSCRSAREISKFFSSLSKGGEIIHPLRAEHQGATFGVFTDRFGISWMLWRSEG